jgi:DNA-binding NarL/FixJ family response regulator
MAYENNSRGVSKREKQVGTLIAYGMTNKEIGVRLGISEFTVKRHVSNLLVKLNLRRRTQIAAIANGENWSEF